jgi:alpha-galactosidase
VVIGAGSYFFARPVIWNMVNSPVLRGGTLTLVDTPPEVRDAIRQQPGGCEGGDGGPAGGAARRAAGAVVPAAAVKVV